MFSGILFIDKHNDFEIAKKTAGNFGQQLFKVFTMIGNIKGFL